MDFLIFSIQMFLAKKYLLEKRNFLKLEIIKFPSQLTQRFLV